MGMETPELNLDQKGEMVQGIFSKIARKYDTFNALSSMGIYKAWLKRVALTAACTPQERVLDVAGGTGDVSFELCRRCPPASVEVSDFTPEMLEVARSRAEAGASCGVPCAFKVADAMNLPYDDESFDVLTMAYGLRNFSDRKRAMREAARVLKRPRRHPGVRHASQCRVASHLPRVSHARRACRGRGGVRGLVGLQVPGEFHPRVPPAGHRRAGTA